MKTRRQVAIELTKSHISASSAIQNVIRCDTENNNESSPILLLEITEDTIPVGVLPIIFAPTQEFPYPVSILVLTPGEFDKLKTGDLSLPVGWQFDEVLFESYMKPRSQVAGLSRENIDWLASGENLKKETDRELLYQQQLERLKVLMAESADTGQVTPEMDHLAADIEAYEIARGWH